MDIPMNPTPAAQPLLQVEGLCISVRGPRGYHPVVRDLSFSVD
eukprot:gene7021-8950_t